MNYLLVRHNSGGSEVGFRCLLTGIEALIRLVIKNQAKWHTVASLENLFIVRVQSLIFIII
jgi:hypothetical protein